MGPRIAVLGAAVVMVSVLVIAPPLGVTDVGLKTQVASAGSPLQAKLSDELNPFSGVNVNMTVPLLSSNNGERTWIVRQLETRKNVEGYVAVKCAARRRYCDGASGRAAGHGGSDF